MTWHIKTEKNTWEVVIGLEVHAQILTKSKLFSSAPADFGADPNSQVNLLDAAMPGTLPVCNGEAVAPAGSTAPPLGGAGYRPRVF